MKYIFISGGVISGLGKGIVTASTALLLADLGFKVSPVKVDMYLNLDAGTLRPQEHGETFVLADGMETDQDMGNYERFLGYDLPRQNYITVGQIYDAVLKRERAFGYEGSTVEAIPHLTDEVARRLAEAGQATKADIVLVELGGTITLQEIQNRVVVEATRIMHLKNPKDVLNIHVSYLPFVKSVGELKSKPTQTSVYILNSMGIQPDFVIARSEVPLDQKRKDKVALLCNVFPEDLILCPDVLAIDEVPLVFAKQQFAQKICQKLGLKGKGKLGGLLKTWQETVAKRQAAKEEVTIGIAGKYYKTGDFGLSDSYLSVVEALKHAATRLDLKVKIKWINSEEAMDFSEISGLIVPQGWGSRGVEGKIAAVKFARENKIPYLGLCFGMQMAVIEFARDVCGLKGANSSEVDPKTKYPVIHLMPDQEKYLARHQYGGTIRLGQWPAVIEKKSKLFSLYHQAKILERHRHRYEFNNKYRRVLESKGLLVSAVSPDGKLVEAIEIPGHPFFIGTQYHPELQSRPLTPHPLFVGFLKACHARSTSKS